MFILKQISGVYPPDPWPHPTPLKLDAKTAPKGSFIQALTKINVKMYDHYTN